MLGFVRTNINNNKQNIKDTNNEIYLIYCFRKQNNELPKKGQTF